MTLKPSDEVNILLIEKLTRELARRKLEDFVQYTFPKYKMTPFHQVYCRILQYFIESKITKLILTVPPQHGKTELSTRRLSAFLWGRDPSLNIAVVSYSTDKARRFGKDIKAVINSPEYSRLFPKTKLPDRSELEYSNSSDVFDIPTETGKGTGFLTGRKGGLTGESIDVLLMDDMYKNREEANSPVIRQAVIDWYNSVGETRLDNTSRQLITFTRWHDNDLVGYLSDTENVVVIESWSQLENADPDNWYMINFEALMAKESTELDPREIGAPLFPEKHSQKKLEKTRERLNKRAPEDWNGLFMGNPRPVTGLLYGAGFKIYEALPELMGRFAYTDVADTGKDFLCTICYGIGVDGFLYLLDVQYTNQPQEITEEETADILIRNKIDRAIVESNAGGRSFARNVERIIKEKRGTVEILTMHQSSNKESRVITNASNVMRLFMMPVNWLSKWPVFGEALMGFRRLFQANDFDDAPDTITGCYEHSGIEGGEIYVEHC